jgi:hypothetical protein
VNVLREHVATLKADNERLNGDLVAERQRADRAIAGLTALARERTPGAARGRSGGGGQGHGRAGRPGAAARRDRRGPRAAAAKQTWASVGMVLAELIRLRHSVPSNHANRGAGPWVTWNERETISSGSRPAARSVASATRSGHGYR